MVDELRVKEPKKKERKPRVKPAQWALNLRNKITSVTIGLGYVATPAFAKKIAIRTAWIIFTLVMLLDFIVLLIHTFWPNALPGTELFILDKIFSFLTGGSN